jgi:hypothetical protein
VRAGALNACPWRRGSGAGEGGTPGRGGVALRPWEEEERASGGRGRPAGGTRLSVSV